MKVFTLFAGVFSVAAGALPVNYDITVTSDRAVCEETAETARAFRLPESSQAVTECNVTVGPSEVIADGYRITFNTFSQNLYMGETTFADEENLSKSLPGKWVEFTLAGLAAGELTRDPNLAVESGYVGYGLVAFMLLYEGGAGDATGEQVFSVVERTLPNGNAVKTAVSFEPAEADIGENFAVTVEQELTQDTGLSKMTGSAVISGIVRRVCGDDGLADCALAELTGTRERDFTIAGKDAVLKEEISFTVDALREGSLGPSEWAE
ncbi:MAG: hypothetical protein JSW52_05480 [Candidatus Coatesbacteria bacterium]|nr:MAG: hypothetical protein JSW52_05480 [Candidatus Coatesbacteria bacterium]